MPHRLRGRRTASGSRDPGRRGRRQPDRRARERLARRDRRHHQARGSRGSAAQATGGEHYAVTTAELIAPADFWAPFETFSYSVFRLETLQSYAGSGEDEDLAAFAAGRPRPPDPGR